MPTITPRSKTKACETRPERRKLEPWVVESFLSSLNANKTMFSDTEPAQAKAQERQGKPRE